jgi:hypothetical protein
MIYLFSNYPSSNSKHIKPETIKNCSRLAREWEAYVIRTNALRKTFVSIKGYYYQAEVHGLPITWLAPHQFPQKVFLFFSISFPFFLPLATHFVQKQKKDFQKSGLQNSAHVLGALPNVDGICSLQIVFRVGLALSTGLEGRRFVRKHH